MKITGILLNTSLYTTERIIVTSVQAEIFSRVLSLRRWIIYFLKILPKRKLKQIAKKVKKNIIHSDDI
jgi:hypothetical protein